MSSARTGFPVTVHILMRQQGKVLLLRRRNTGYRDGWFSLVAGHVETGEPLQQAAAREIWEEVGVSVQLENLKPVGVMHRRSNDQRVDFFLQTRTWQGQVFNKETTKASEIGWFSPKRLPVKTIPYIKRALANTAEGFWFDEFGWDMGHLLNEGETNFD